MGASGLFDPDPLEPLSLFERTVELPATLEDASGVQLELSSRGDRVGVLLALPDVARGERPRPLVLLARAGGALPSAVGAWLSGGAAVAMVDLPLFGSRSSPKLTAMLEGAVERATAGAAVGTAAETLWAEFARQAVLDLRRSIDVLAARADVDGAHMAVAAAGLAASPGMILCAEEPRLIAGALGLVGAGIGPAAVDPLSFVSRVTRPLLLVGVRDAGPGEAAARKLFEAAGDAARRESIEAPQATDRALAAATPFLEEALAS